MLLIAACVLSGATIFVRWRRRQTGSSQATQPPMLSRPLRELDLQADSTPGGYSLLVADPESHHIRWMGITVVGLPRGDIWARPDTESRPEYGRFEETQRFLRPGRPGQIYTFHRSSQASRRLQILAIFNGNLLKVELPALSSCGLRLKSLPPGNSCTLLVTQHDRPFYLYCSALGNGRFRVTDSRTGETTTVRLDGGQSWRSLVVPGGRCRVRVGDGTEDHYSVRAIYPTDLRSWGVSAYTTC